MWNLFFGNDGCEEDCRSRALVHAAVCHVGLQRRLASWGDAGNNAKWLPNFGTGWGRAGRCYRSGLNMIPLIEWYRAHPDDSALLQIAMGAIVASWSTSTQQVPQA